MNDLKLYNIPRDSKIYCDLDDGSTFMTFNRRDGMYSHCTTEKGGTTHLSASCPLEVHEDGYKIKSKENE